MKFTVTWRVSAEHKLTEMWLGSRDREAISEATTQIEQILGSSPLNAGESRSGDYRILIADPLAVVFSVWPEDRLVKIVEVSRTRMNRGRS